MPCRVKGVIMAKTYTTQIASTTDTYLLEPREIVAVIPAGEYLRSDGTKSENVVLALAGPKGGVFHMPVPEWFFAAHGETIKPGIGISGGWRNQRFDAVLWEDPEA